MTHFFKQPDILRKRITNVNRDINIIIRIIIFPYKWDYFETRDIQIIFSV